MAKKSYIYLLICVFYTPLIVGAIYSFSTGAKRGDMPVNFSYSREGWHKLLNDENIVLASLNTLFIAIIVTLIVLAVSLLAVYGLWRQKNKTIKGFVSVTNNIPLINPDVITAISLSIAFGVMFGALKGPENTGYFRLIFAQVAMILPYGITIMYPRSEKFKVSLLEASKDLGYGPLKTWFKTYFRHMLPVVAATFAVSMALSFDDFIVTRIVSKEDTVGKLMYQGSLDPWVLALGTIMLAITFSATIITTAVVGYKQKRKVVKR